MLGIFRGLHPQQGPYLAAEFGRHTNGVFRLLRDNLLSFQMQACQPKCSCCPGSTMHELPDAGTDGIGLECDHPGLC